MIATGLPDMSFTVYMYNSQKKTYETQWTPANIRSYQLVNSTGLSNKTITILDNTVLTRKHQNNTSMIFSHR